jgi:hypothetical protein
MIWNANLSYVNKIMNTRKRTTIQFPWTAGCPACMLQQSRLNENWLRRRACVGEESCQFCSNFADYLSLMVSDKVRFGLSSNRFGTLPSCSNTGLDFRSGPAIVWTLNRTSVRFWKVRIRTLVLNRTTASLMMKGKKKQEDKSKKIK